MVNDPRTGGRWPVHSVVGHRSTREGAVEYLIRWVGFGSTYDTWLSRRYLDTIAHLVSLYDENKGRALPPVARADRPQDEPTPPPATVARDTPRFRRRQHADPLAAAPSATDPRVDADTAPGDDLSQPLEDRDGPPQGAEPSATSVDLSDRFPVGTRVDVHYPRDDKWWTGTVVHSYVYRPRTSGEPPERRITVKYDDGAYKGEVFMHGLNGSEVRLHDSRSNRREVRAGRLHDNSSTPADERVQRRLARVARQLASPSSVDVRR